MRVREVLLSNVLILHLTFFYFFLLSFCYCYLKVYINLFLCYLIDCLSHYINIKKKQKKKKKIKDY